MADYSGGGGDQPCSSSKLAKCEEEEEQGSNINVEEKDSLEDNQLIDPWHGREIKDEERYLTHRLCDETLLKILREVHLDGDDEALASLSLTCSKMKTLILDKELCDKICIAWWAKVNKSALMAFIKDQPRPALLTRVDLSDLYWVPSWMLRDVLIKLVNVTELYVAGTTISWTHLYEIIEKLNCISKLSMTYDSTFEAVVRQNTFRLTLRNPTELAKIAYKLENLKHLLIHIPMPSSSTTSSASSEDLLPRAYEAPCVKYTYTGVACLLSCCAKLEELWIVGWPKTSQERKLTVYGGTETELPNGAISLPYLKKLVVSMKEWPRMSASTLTQQLFLNLKINNDTHKRSPEIVWLDHPLLDLGVGPYVNRAGSNRRCGRRNMTTFMGSHVVRAAKRLSYSLTHANANNPARVPGSPNLTHLLLMHGAPSLVTVNVYDFGITPSNLQSFCVTAFNVRIDWDSFVKTHSNLKELAILNYVDGTHNYCSHLATLDKLEKLSISFDCLFEAKTITSKELLDKLISVSEEKLQSFDDNIPEVELKPSKSCEVALFKPKKRVALQAGSSGADSNVDRPSGLTLLSIGCPNISELEIGYDLTPSTGRDRAGPILCETLASISRWKHLKKLSLKGLPITNGKFFFEIFSKCTKLESLRLTNLGLSGKCNYILHLASALPKCQNLRDFRLEQNNIGSLFGLFEALSSCPKLRRILVYSYPNDQPLNPKPVFDLFRNCPELTMFYAIIDKTAKREYQYVRKYLEQNFLQSRPALNVIIRNSTEEDDLIRYPSVHYRSMVVDQSQVCQFNDFTGIYDSPTTT